MAPGSARRPAWVPWRPACTAAAWRVLRGLSGGTSGVCRGVCVAHVEGHCPHAKALPHCLLEVQAQLVVGLLELPALSVRGVQRDLEVRAPVLKFPDAPVVLAGVRRLRSLAGTPFMQLSPHQCQLGVLGSHELLLVLRGVVCLLQRRTHRRQLLVPRPQGLLVLPRGRQEVVPLLRGGARLAQRVLERCQLRVPNPQEVLLSP
mmetsp:Transcript_21807/g.65532  ORF Transcript_21807/g.65532 Transcript_21807/m.65532 type:complete len:204 (+) Transcript_21807:184-795(+)